MPENDEKSPSKGEQTQAALVEAGFELFLTQGYHGTSMRQIADKAGLALGGIYNHFASKEEIFVAVLETYHPLKRILPKLGQAQGETVEEFVTDAARQIRTEVEGVVERVVPLALAELVEFQGRHLAQMINGALPTMLTFVQRFSERRGKLRRVPTPIMLRMFMATMAGYMLTEVVLQRAPVFRDMQLSWFDGMIDIYLHGILEAED